MSNTEVTECELIALHAELDRQHFGGRLTAAGWRTVRIVPLPAKYYGSAVYSSRTIRIAEHSVGDAVETRKTLLHEMIHAWLRLIRDPSHQGRNEAHGAAFKAELDRLIAAGEDVRSEHEYVTCGDTSAEQLQAAVDSYLARQSRREYPDGHFDNAYRWYPNRGEAQVCCRSQRPPSRAYPHSLRTHCCTMTHISLSTPVENSTVLAVENCTP